MARFENVTRVSKVKTICDPDVKHCGSCPGCILNATNATNPSEFTDSGKPIPKFTRREFTDACRVLYEEWRECEHGDRLPDFEECLAYIESYGLPVDN